MSEPDQSSNRRMGRYMIFAMWITAMALTFVLVEGWMERQANPNNDIVTSIDGDKRSITLQRNRGGHYQLTGYLGTVPAVFLIDTGATNVSVPSEIANEAGLIPGHEVVVDTANGIATVHRTRIPSLKMGDLEIRNAVGNINPGLSGSVLIGMSVLQHYELVQRGDQLTIREP